MEVASSQGFSQDALLNAAFLWGSIFSGRTYNEPHYLSLVLENLPKAYDARPINLLHVLQTEILLANYYFYYGKFVEARNHLSSAVSIVLTYKMHKIRSAHDYLSRTLELTSLDSNFPYPADSVEEGERIYAFWWVYILDKSWSAALNVESLLLEDGSPSTRRLTVDSTMSASETSEASGSESAAEPVKSPRPLLEPGNEVKATAVGSPTTETKDPDSDSTIGAPVGNGVQTAVPDSDIAVSLRLP